MSYFRDITQDGELFRPTRWGVAMDLIYWADKETAPGVPLPK